MELKKLYSHYALRPVDVAAACGMTRCALHMRGSYGWHADFSGDDLIFYPPKSEPRTSVGVRKKLIRMGYKL